jgi:hypothetical protein
MAFQSKECAEDAAPSGLYLETDIPNVVNKSAPTLLERLKEPLCEQKTKNA